MPSTAAHAARVELVAEAGHSRPGQAKPSPGAEVRAVIRSWSPKPVRSRCPRGCRRRRTRRGHSSSWLPKQSQSPAGMPVAAAHAALVEQVARSSHRSPGHGSCRRRHVRRTHRVGRRCRRRRRRPGSVPSPPHTPQASSSWLPKQSQSPAGMPSPPHTPHSSSWLHEAVTVGRHRWSCRRRGPRSCPHRRKCRRRPRPCRCHHTRHRRRVGFRRNRSHRQGCRRHRRRRTHRGPQAGRVGRVRIVAGAEVRAVVGTVANAITVGVSRTGSAADTQGVFYVAVAVAVAGGDAGTAAYIAQASTAADKRHWPRRCSCRR